jgi:methyl-accepting chemotaxis protein
MATADGKVYIENFTSALNNFVDINEEVRDTSRENGNAKAFELSANKGRELNDKAIELIAGIVVINEKALDDDNITSTDNHVGARNLMILLDVGHVLAINELSKVVEVSNDLNASLAN